MPSPKVPEGEAVTIQDGFVIPQRGYQDPYRVMSKAQVRQINNVLAERDHRSLSMSEASRNRLAQQLSKVNDFHQLFR